ncbi:MAG: topoisomerase-4 subunit A [Sphingobacteriales bacterium]|jgi:topoisomerase-4 subunit A
MSENNPSEESNVKAVSGLYEDWFLDYASYVILDRAVPHIQDGFKPVQRRIIHSLKELDDGRFNKVANVIGNTMKYHPHGDASIGDAMVQLGQKELLIETQGNWGNILTGDNAAAPRYIEARLSKFALDVVFNPETTQWQNSYDGRNKEPITFPLKFPLLLAQGVEGIAVGLSTKVLPHNFIELIDASIKHLKGKSFEILPDFPTGGMADFSRYNAGERGGKVRVRAKIELVDKKTLSITEIPFSTTTNSLIDSIISANDKGKIKIKQIEDNTARNVEIILHLAPGISPDLTLDALYAFTNCEVSISPNACVIEDNKPRFMGVTEMLRMSTDRTLNLLRQELEIKKGHLLEKILFSSLERIFIENRIYRDIEECETWEEVIKTIDKGLTPFKAQFYREITEDDIVRLTEIRIKRISKFDSFKADEVLKGFEEALKEVEHHLKHLTDYAIAYFENLKAKYSKGRERKTEIKVFDTVSASAVALANQKLYVNREEGFVGIGLKKDEYIGECSDLDDIIVFLEDGHFVVTKVSDKTFVGKGIIHAAVWKKGDERTVYNMVYRDGTTGVSYMKRFSVKSITRDKPYDLTTGNKGNIVTYFTANPNGEAELITVYLKPVKRVRKLEIEINFAELEIKGRGSKGNQVTKYPIRKIVLTEEGISTLAGINMWFDEVSKRLNTSERGLHLGEFQADDKILVIYEDGQYELTNYELTNHYQGEIMLIERFRPTRVVSVIHYDPEHKCSYLKRFNIEITSEGKRSFISEEKGAKLLFVSTDAKPRIKVSYKKTKTGLPDAEELMVDEFIDVKGWKAQGNKVSTKYDVAKIVTLDSEPVEEEEEIPVVIPEVEEVVPKEAEVENTESEKQPEEETTPKVESKPKEEAKAKEEPKTETDKEEAAKEKDETLKPEVKKAGVDLEITNPDDIEEGGGQGKLF